MLPLFAEGEFPDGPMDVLLAPLVAAFIGLGLFYLAIWLESRGRKVQWSWAAFVPLAIATYLGGSVLYKWLTNPIYAQMASAGAAKRMTAAHWAAFLIPLLCFLAVALYPLYKHRVNLVSEE